jgi:Uncharacterised nucleotidyltransferase
MGFDSTHRDSTHQSRDGCVTNLRQLGFSTVPDVVQNELKGAYPANALRNQLLAEELARLLHLLNDAGIPVFPLKGAPLAQSVYGDPAARVCSDIDIIVPPMRLHRAIEVILSAGYPDTFRDPFFRKLALRHGRHYQFQRDHPASTLVELHWRLVQYSSRNDSAVTDLWAEARPTHSCGAPDHAFSPEWEFLYLAIHAADHRWHLKWLVDLHQICLCRRPDWRRLTDKTDQFELDLVAPRLWPLVPSCWIDAADMLERRCFNSKRVGPSS